MPPQIEAENKDAFVASAEAGLGAKQEDNIGFSRAVTPIRVVYDDQAFLWFKYSSSSRYFCELIAAYSTNGGADVCVTFARSNNVPLNMSPLVQARRYRRPGGGLADACGRMLKFGLSFPLFSAQRKAYRVQINRRHSIFALKEGNFDVFHPTHFDPYFLRYIGAKPFVLTVNSCVYELYPELLNRDKAFLWRRGLIEKATRIITTSVSAKHDLLKLYKVKPEKIAVVYNACSLAQASGSVDMVLPKRFFLLIGYRGLHKNFFMFLSAFRKLAETDKSLQVVCVGGGRFSRHEMRVFRHFKLEGRFLQMEASDDQLAHMYANAIALVDPSLCEGSAMSLLEAFKCGCPVICSDGDVTKEIAGSNAAVYFDPKDVEGMADALRWVADDLDLQNRLRLAGNERSLCFSWKRCAGETLKVYEAACAG